MLVLHLRQGRRWAMAVWRGSYTSNFLLNSGHDLWLAYNRLDSYGPSSFPYNCPTLGQIGVLQTDGTRLKKRPEKSREWAIDPTIRSVTSVKSSRPIVRAFLRCSLDRFQ